ncbi:MAG: hypothetical protein LBV05_12835 [Comamonas sp.]|jgi:hypothetical protein|uniref:hypothetical protein n=1 Tax=Comamonas sp. TaxID=34028 RepID=UPI0028460302|nr:hypothetical protein [Comamonas sp.]MDR3066372.1 hypothetical protein [Comamonas sp.]
MAYPLINGASINGAEGGAGTQGIDLVAYQAPVAARSAIGQDAFALSFGTAAIQFTISPPGLDLARAEPHVIKFNRNLIPAGVDLVRSQPPTVAVHVADSGHMPMEFGAARVQIGQDVGLAVGGLDLARLGPSGIVRGSPPAVTAIQANGLRAMELGHPSVDAGALSVMASGAQPLEVGHATVGVHLLAQQAHPLSLGDPMAAIRLQAATVLGLELGEPGSLTALASVGIDLGRAGVAQVLPQAAVLHVAGYQAFELGVPTDLPVQVRSRQFFPLALGQPSVYRGITC